MNNDNSAFIGDIEVNNILGLLKIFTKQKDSITEKKVIQTIKNQ